VTARDGEIRKLTEVETPALVVDQQRFTSNVARMRARLSRLGVPLRPHVKTMKSWPAAQRALAGQPGGITVSTLGEAEYFADRGITDILYAVSVAPHRLNRAAAVIRRGAQLTLVLDNAAAVSAVAAAGEALDVRFPVLIELDVDGHRAGVHPDSEHLLEIARLLDGEAGVELRGVMTHAGSSYDCFSAGAHRDIAEAERAGATRAAQRLNRAGMHARVVSVGSTPTATYAQDLQGVTEVGAGVYMLHDLVMAGIGVCELGDVALSVLVTVIGHQSGKRWLITDGGWMALSRDRGTAQHPIDQGYGIVCDVRGRILEEDLICATTSQEHGVLVQRNGEPFDLDRFPIGTRLRILPNHACATGAMHPGYHVVNGENIERFSWWERFNGW